MPLCPIDHIRYVYLNYIWNVFWVCVQDWWRCGVLYYFDSVSVLGSLKLECEKLASEKTEMQRHYIMVSSILFTPHHRWLTGINQTTWGRKAQSQSGFTNGPLSTTPT